MPGNKTATLQSAAGAIADGQSLDVAGLSTAVFKISGTFVATVAFEGSLDEGATWDQFLVHRVDAAGTPARTATTTGTYRGSCAGFTHVRTPISAYTSGSVTVKAYGSAAVPLAEDMTVTGSNFEGASGSTAPAKAVLIGGKEASLLREISAAAYGDGLNPATAYHLSVLARMTGTNGSTADMVRVANVHKNAQNGALAAGARLVLWAPATNKKIRVHWALVCVSVTGAYTLTFRDGAGTETKRMATLLLTANQPFLLLLPANGALAPTANDTLEISNNTAGAAEVYGSATGNEE